MEKTLIQKDTCTSLFIAALFTIAKTWKQPTCPSTDEWIKNGILLRHKKNDIMPFTATRMDLEMIRSSKVSQKKKDSYHMMSLICGIQNMTQNEPIYKAETLADVENRAVVAQGECAGGGMGWDFGISICKLLYMEWINNKVLLYSAGNYSHYPVIIHNGEEYA